MSFKIGDVVGLKSGGTNMTVTNPAAGGVAPFDSQVACSWFDGKRFRKEVFPPDALERRKSDQEIADESGGFLA